NKYKVYRYVYDHTKSITQNGTELAQFVNNYDFAGKQIIVIAHSMGGLVARYSLNYNQQFRSSVGGLVTLATPHFGSPLADPSWAYAELNSVEEEIYDAV